MNKMTKICCCCNKDFNLDEGLPFFMRNNKYVCPDCCQEAAIKFDDFLTESPKNIPAPYNVDQRIAVVMKKMADRKEAYEKAMSGIPDIIEFNKNIILGETLQYVRGQDSAVRKLILNICENMKITDYHNKQNILIVGNTGCGKTYSIETILKEMDICYTIVDGSKYSEVGYIGDSVEDCIQKLVNNCKGDLSKAERGVVVIDEFDKLRGQGGIGRDVSGTSVQEELLTLMSGEIVDVNFNNKKGLPFSTNFVTFILMGAFDSTGDEDSLFDIRKKRLGDENKKIGFSVDNTSNIELQEEIFNSKLYLASDFSKYGILSQITGRCPVIIEYNPMTKEIAKDIFFNSRNSQFNYFYERFIRNGVELEIPELLIDKICEYAATSDTGARGISRFLSILFSEVLEKIEFDYDDGILYEKCIFYEDSLIDNTHFDLIPVNQLLLEMNG